jgi:hypothetical protein
MRKGLAVLALLLLAPGLAGWIDPGVPGDTPEREDFPPGKYPVFSATFLTFFLWQNDRDFDSTDPLFNEYGQSVGYFDVRVYPRLTWRPTEAVMVHYFAEVGGALWSQQSDGPNPDLVVTQPVYIQKELWAQILLPGNAYGFRIGFQYIYDPTLLFLEKYVGAFTGFYRNEGTAFRLIALQVPDTVYEGIEFDENNFQNDDFVFATDATLSPTARLRVKPGLYFEFDRTDVDRPKYLWNPCLNLAYDFEAAGRWELDAALQAGVWENRSIGNRNLDLLAGAVQVHGRVEVGKAAVEANLLCLTPDDGDPYNGVNTGFQYSGFSRSRTLLLSQNWILDQYNNLDEKAAAAGAGVFLADLFAHVPVATGLDLFGVVGYEMALEDRYVLGGRTIGTEVDAGVSWQPYHNAKVIGVGGTVLPGAAGAALVNEINLYACDPIYYFQAAVAVTF